MNFLDYITGIGDTATDIIGAVRSTERSSQGTQTTPRASGLPTWLPWAAGGAVLLVVLVLVFKR